MKRGLSEVVTAVILILLVLAAVAIIWAFIRPTIEDTSSRVGVSQFTSTLGVVSKSVNIDDNNDEVNFTVSKGAGGNVEGFVVILRDDQGNEEINRTYESTPLAELESEKVSLKHSLPGEIIEIEIVSIFNVNGENQLSSIKSTYSVRTGTTVVSNPNPQSQCGNGVVNASAGEQCDNGASNGVVCNPSYGGSCSYCSGSCSLVNLTGPYCGDGLISNGNEVCDGTNFSLGGNSCTLLNQSFVSGTYSCSPSCNTYITTSCNLPSGISYPVSFDDSTTPLNGASVSSSVPIRLKFNNTIFGSSLNRYSFVDVDNSILFWMRFDDVNGSGQPQDISGNGRHGIFRGAASVDNSNVKYGNTLSNNGVSGTNWLELPAGDTLGLAGRTNFSVSLWFRPNSLPFPSGSFPGLIGIGNNVGNRTLFLFGYGGSSNISLNIGTVTGGSTDCNIPPVNPNFVAGNWYHIVVLRNSSTCSLYVDGVLRGSDGFLGSNTMDSAYPAGFSRIASLERTSGLNNWNLNGNIDEVIVFGRTLKLAEIDALKFSTYNTAFGSSDGIGVGPHSFKGYAVNTTASWNSTETRTITLT